MKKGLNLTLSSVDDSDLNERCRILMDRDADAAPVFLTATSQGQGARSAGGG